MHTASFLSLLTCAQKIFEKSVIQIIKEYFNDRQNDSSVIMSASIDIAHRLKTSKHATSNMQILKTRELQHNCMIYKQKHTRHDICVDTSGMSIGNSSDNQVTAVTYSNSSDIMTIVNCKNS